MLTLEDAAFEKLSVTKEGVTSYALVGSPYCVQSRPSTVLLIVLLEQVVTDQFHKNTYNGAYLIGPPRIPPLSLNWLEA